jgi:uncharacterized protein
LKLGNQYIIPYRGLKDGDHKFEFGFEKLFFEKHEVLEVSDGQIKAEILLSKTPQLLSLKIIIEGFLKAPCDRCLEYFNFPVNYNCNLIIKFSENIAESTDEVWIIHPNDNEIDLEQFFFECIGLSIPLQKIHPKDKSGKPGCNSDMLEIIKNHSPAFEKDTEKIDPRWNKLKDLLNDNNNLN